VGLVGQEPVLFAGTIAGKKNFLIFLILKKKFQKILHLAKKMPLKKKSKKLQNKQMLINLL
jgi:hypothetical protein